MEFLIFNVSFIFLVILYFYLGQVKKTSVMLLLGVIVIFFSPIWYMNFGGEKYKAYSLDSYHVTIFIAIFSILLIAIYIICHLFFSRNFLKVRACVVNYRRVLNVYLTLYSLLLLYIIYYSGHWPLLNAFSGNIVDRPDVVKSVFKGYFLFSVIVNVVMPSLCLLYLDKNNIHWFKKITLLVSLIFLLLVGGNKGVFMYFIIFCIIFLWRDFKIMHYLFVAILGIFVYALIRLPYLKDGVNFGYLFESIIERVLITQGMSIPNVIEFSKINNVYEMSSNELKYRLFEFVYGYSPGSMPIYYTAEIYVRHGILVLCLIGIIISLFLSFSFSYLERKDNIGVNWVIFMSLYVLVMSGVATSSLYIYVFSLLWVFVLFLLSNFKFNFN
ncbi:hypothetical protein FCV50_05615 [Vibrio kanaloae]|uniref:Oligosaccharide repeat unit polymerase n=1 Tax=Vibrio kanaloae TaxID=170673 RepID=A0A4V5R5N0_9VIBR|nr:hypothetical protein [Vibrio kanaloae]TKF34098.1 hypothetical protein FCV50_05615 [Vibrio kanaloae]